VISDGCWRATRCSDPLFGFFVEFLLNSVEGALEFAGGIGNPFFDGTHLLVALALIFQLFVVGEITCGLFNASFGLVNFFVVHDDVDTRVLGKKN